LLRAQNGRERHQKRERKKREKKSRSINSRATIPEKGEKKEVTLCRLSSIAGRKRPTKQEKGKEGRSAVAYLPSYGRRGTGRKKGTTFRHPSSSITAAPKEEKTGG